MKLPRTKETGDRLLPYGSARLEKPRSLKDLLKGRFGDGGVKFDLLYLIASAAQNDDLEVGLS